MFSLKHTFDSDYGLAQNATDNLMDYTGGLHLAKWQWDLMYDPVGVFERDEDAMKVGNALSKDYEKINSLINEIGIIIKEYGL